MTPEWPYLDILQEYLRMHFLFLHVPHAIFSVCVRKCACTDVMSVFRMIRIMEFYVGDRY
jgi:hypothetical protein